MVSKLLAGHRIAVDATRTVFVPIDAKGDHDAGAGALGDLGHRQMTAAIIKHAHRLTIRDGACDSILRVNQ